MIPRYSRSEMAAIWSAENRYRIWFEIEAHALDAMADLGVVPREAAQKVWAWWRTEPAIDIARIDAIEAETKHDVIAFLTWVSEQVGPEARFLHQGMTSSDVLDTALAVQLAQATDILLADLDKLLAVLKRRAQEHKLTPTIGRSHGIHAEPVTFGLKLAPGLCGVRALPERLGAGAGGDRNLCHFRRGRAPSPISTRLWRRMSRRRWGWKWSQVSTQVIPRDRHAMFFAPWA
jgi:adenylosuccinate lyase